MFKNKSANGRNNICGEKVYALRKAHVPRMSQRILAEKLQINGIDVDGFFSWDDRDGKCLQARSEF